MSKKFDVDDEISKELREKIPDEEDIVIIPPAGQIKEGEGRTWPVEVRRSHVQYMAQLFCSSVDIAKMYGVDEHTIRNRFSEQLVKGREVGRLQIRRKQRELALSGSHVMLIWLGKNELNQKDRSEVDHKGTLPERELTVKVVQVQSSRGAAAEVVDKDEADTPGEPQGKGNSIS